MRSPLSPDALHTLLNRPQAALDALYAIVGDEPLLQIETGDLLRSAAVNAGYTERTSLLLDARSDWSQIMSTLQNTSLFGDRKLLELKIPGGKPGRTGSDTLLQLVDWHKHGRLDNAIIVISLPRLDAATRKSKWASQLLAAATEIAVRPVDRRQLPAWIASRLNRQHQQVDSATLEWIADKVEGNLLAAHQEIQKLALLYPEGHIEAMDVEQAVLNVARYDVFELRDAMLSGNGKRALTILFGLKAEGEALPLVLWAVGDEIRLLARLAQAQEHNESLSALIRQNRIFGERERLVRQALSRTTSRSWPPAVQHAHDIDRIIKGLTVSGRLNDAWEELARLTLRVVTLMRPTIRG